MNQANTASGPREGFVPNPEARLRESRQQLGQIPESYSRRSQLGLLTISSEAGIVQQFQSTDLLPQVRATLKHHERWVN